MGDTSVRSYLALAILAGLLSPLLAQAPSKTALLRGDPPPITPFLPTLEGPAKAKAGRIVQFRITGHAENCAVEWDVPDAFDDESYKVADDGLSITVAHDAGVYTLRCIVSCNGETIEGKQQPPRIHRLRHIFELTGPRPPPDPVPDDPLPPPDDPIRPKITGAYVALISESEGRPAGSTQMMQRVLASLPAIEAQGAIIDPDQLVSGTNIRVMEQTGYSKALSDAGVSPPAIIVIDPKGTAGKKVLKVSSLPSTESDILSVIKEATGH